MDAAYLCTDPEACSVQAELWRGEEGGRGEVEGEKDEVPEEILLCDMPVSTRWF